jgi:hypothetical protein
MYTRQEYFILFKDYIIDETETCLRINLPRSLISHVLGFYPQNDYIDMEWYEKETYKDHPYSLFNIENKKNDYIKKYDEWRHSLKIKEKNSSDELHDNLSNFNDLLKRSSKNENPNALIIGESHEHSAPNAILMHNIDFLKEKKAIIFLEGLYVEMQDELNKSVTARKPTAIVKAFLINAKHSGESNSFYSKRNLILTCIQEGIPVIACDNFLSVICGENCKIEDDRQIGDISRMTMNYECFNAIKYAEQHLPNHAWNIFLVGDAHTCTYRSKEDINDVHPGLIDVTSGVYIHAMDTISQLKYIKANQILISKEAFFKIINSFGVLKEESAKRLNVMLFSDGNVTPINELMTICRIDSPFETYPKNLSKDLKAIIADYSKYIQINPAKELINSPIEGYTSSIGSGYQIIAQDESEIVEKEGSFLSLVNPSLPTGIEPEFIILPSERLQYTKVTTDEIKEYILKANSDEVDISNKVSNFLGLNGNNPIQQSVAYSNAPENNIEKIQPQDLNTPLIEAINVFCQQVGNEKVDGLVKIKIILQNPALENHEKINQIIELAEWKKSDNEVSSFFHKEIRKRTPEVELFYQRLSGLDQNNPVAIAKFINQYQYTEKNEPINSNNASI